MDIEIVDTYGAYMSHLFSLEQIGMYDVAVEDAGAEGSPGHGRDQPEQEDELDFVVEREPARKRNKTP